MHEHDAAMQSTDSLMHRIHKRLHENVTEPKLRKNSVLRVVSCCTVLLRANVFKARNFINLPSHAITVVFEVGLPTMGNHVKFFHW